MVRVNLEKRVGCFELVLRFEHKEGFLILFGRSGAGKTTALRLIAGIDKPGRGEITLDGRTLFCSKRGINVSVQRRSIGFIFQHHNLFPHMTAYQNIAYAAKDLGGIERWLDTFHVAHLTDRYPNQMSGGEQQRIAIIRALMTRPKMLLMDEPLSAVDMATRNVLLDELRELQRKSGIPIIYVTHNVAEAFRLGDRVLVLEEGKVIHDGVPIDVFQTPTTVPLAGLSGTENILNAVVVGHHADDGTTELRVRDTVLHVPLFREEVGETVVVAIRPEDILVASHEISGTSARNQLRGHIAEIAPTGTDHSTLPSIRVVTPDGISLRARVTRRSLKTLGLTEGAEVHLLIKAWAIHPVETDRSAPAAESPKPST